MPERISRRTPTSPPSRGGTTRAIQTEDVRETAARASGRDADPEGRPADDA